MITAYVFEFFVIIQYKNKKKITEFILYFQIIVENYIYLQQTYKIKLFNEIYIRNLNTLIKVKVT